MSDGSQSPVERPVRPLCRDEREIVQALLSKVYGAPDIEQRLANALVQQMSDGGMGSIRFVKSVPYRQLFGQEISSAEYIDDDGVLVHITANLDQEGQLFEVDFWKVDFSSLLRYPKPQDLNLHEAAPNHAKSSEAAMASRV